MWYSIFRRSLFILCLTNSLHASINDPLRICALRITFEEDEQVSTTGNGKFLNENEGINCLGYTIDPPPHDREYFQSQLLALDSYLRSVSYGEFGVDIQGSSVYPTTSNGSYS